MSIFALEVEQNGRPVPRSPLSSLLLPFAAAYGLTMRVRRRVWMSPFMPRFRASCACVSVGNIAWGGTGKTPLVEWIMHWAAGKGVRAVTLSRGYKARPRKLPVMVTSRHTAREVGDEPLMLALSCPGIPVLVDPERRRAAGVAMARLRPELIVLDDGFQHVAMDRDLDLVLLRPSDLEEQWNRVIPAGSWREPEAALSRAGAFLVKCPPDAADAVLSAASRRLARFGRPLFSFFLAPLHLRRIGGNEILTADAVRNRPYTLVAGVGEPDQVAATVTAYLGYAPERVVIRPDHHRYTFREAEQFAAARTMIVCTAKDAAKLRLFPMSNAWYLRTEPQFGPALWTDQSFPDWWDAWWRARNSLP